MLLSNLTSMAFKVKKQVAQNFQLLEMFLEMLVWVLDWELQIVVSQDHMDLGKTQVVKISLELLHSKTINNIKVVINHKMDQFIHHSQEVTLQASEFNQINEADKAYIFINLLNEMNVYLECVYNIV